MTHCRRAVSLDSNVHSAGGARSRLLSGVGGLLIRAGMVSVEEDPAWNAATPQDREQFQRVLRKYDAILDPGKGHARCLAAVLVYTAGMICFGCDPEWAKEVETDDGRLVRILVSVRSCAGLWSDCAAFGLQARDLREAILDSSLALRQDMPMEPLHMFEDQQSLCDWAHDAIAMHPFTTPSELEKETTPPISELARRRLADSVSRGNASSKSKEEKVTYGSQQREYDAMMAGKASGFDMTWQGMTARSGAAAWRRSVLSVPLLVSAAWVEARAP
ncbi:unnamed protein product [Polarella glacialis]|uniref:Uncharacterized protein n=1 Tax=Polarella glacialis TaxID=89957 RepID=A0A813LAM7_POLGL|nr:unnamed protein product [Polarella glacialis]